MGGINNSQLNELKNGVLKGNVLGVKQEEKELVYDEVIRELIKRLDLRNSTNIPSHILGITQSDIDRWNNKITAEVDPTISSFLKSITQADIDRWNNDEKGIISESDPTIASFLKSITQEDIDRWNNDEKGLLSEVDPSVASWIKSITQADIDNWNSKLSESDPSVPSHVKNITQEDKDNWNATIDEEVILTEDTNFSVEGDTQKIFNRNVSETLQNHEDEIIRLNGMNFISIRNLISTSFYDTGLRVFDLTTNLR